ncbi:hypothetical protein NT6N_33800 [Oceaniferula spumae]|uniref:Uncharacterized protein n=1 Tax=Oceaniferula spumae TaxID=2979115 RepID=A0AAT9FQQ3_9BACT
MKTRYQILAACAISSLPLGALLAEPAATPNPQTEKKAEKDENKTVQLEVTGMT